MRCCLGGCGYYYSHHCQLLDDSGLPLMWPLSPSVAPELPALSAGKWGQRGTCYVELIWPRYGYQAAHPSPAKLKGRVRNRQNARERIFYGNKEALSPRLLAPLAAWDRGSTKEECPLAWGSGSAMGQGKGTRSSQFPECLRDSLTLPGNPCCGFPSGEA